MHLNEILRKRRDTYTDPRRVFFHASPPKPHGCFFFLFLFYSHLPVYGNTDDSRDDNENSGFNDKFFLVSMEATIQSTVFHVLFSVAFSCFRFILPSFHLSPKYDLSFCGILSQRPMHYGSRCCRMLDGTQRELIIIKLVGFGNTQRTPRVVSINIGFLHM